LFALDEHVFFSFLFFFIPSSNLRVHRSGLEGRRLPCAARFTPWFEQTRRLVVPIGLCFLSTSFTYGYNWTLFFFCAIFYHLRVRHLRVRYLVRSGLEGRELPRTARFTPWFKQTRRLVVPIGLCFLSTSFTYGYNWTLFFSILCHLRVRVHAVIESVDCRDLMQGLLPV